MNPTPKNFSLFASGCKKIAATLTTIGSLITPAWCALIDNGNGTVSDTTTSLVWDQCPYGLSGAACATGTVFVGGWPSALAAAVAANNANHRGFSGWRVPNFNELESIVKIDSYTDLEPTIDASAFPGTPAEDFWTSTTGAPGTPTGAWVVSFVQGYAGIDLKTAPIYVRLVRGGQPSAAFDLLAAPTDTTPPVTTGPTVSSGPTQTTVGISVAINEAGTGYWLRLPAASAAPSVLTVVGTGTNVALSANVQTSINLSGLTANTAYKLYFVAKDTANNLQAATTSVTFTTTVADTIPPVTTGPTVSGGPTAVTAGISVAINEAGTGYWLRLPATAAAPSVATVVGTGTSLAMSANVQASINLIGLTVNTGYKLYFVAKDTAGNLQAAVSSVTFTTSAVADTTPPVTTSGPSVSSGPTATAASISVAINEAGTGYWLRLPATSAAPSAATVVTTGTSLTMSANVQASIKLSGLAANTAYKLYFVAKDTDNNLQASPSSVALTTASLDLTPILMLLLD